MKLEGSKARVMEVKITNWIWFVRICVHILQLNKNMAVNPIFFSWNCFNFCTITHLYKPQHKLRVSILTDQSETTYSALNGEEIVWKWFTWGQKLTGLECDLVEQNIPAVLLTTTIHLARRGICNSCPLGHFYFLNFLLSQFNIYFYYNNLTWKIYFVN